LANWQRRHATGGEYLTKEAQFRQVYDEYSTRCAVGRLTELQVTFYDYERGREWSTEEISSRVARCHDTAEPSAGNRQARVLIVGEALANHSDYDSFYQHPFCGLNPAGCSWWLTERLADAGIRERDLLWANIGAGSVSVVLSHNRHGDAARVVALGVAALKWIEMFRTPTFRPPRLWPQRHPQFWRRFCRAKPYPLIETLKVVTT
jgi:hypothetical protein